MWQAYLWSRRINADLAQELKEMILITLKKQPLTSTQKLEELDYLFASICLEYPDLYSAEEQRHALKVIGEKGLKNIARFMLYSLNQDDNDNYWNNRIKPFIKRAWPKEPLFIDEECSSYLALICIKLHESFSTAVELIRPLIKPFNDLNFFLGQLEQTELPEKKPIEAFNLLTTVFTTKYRWPNDSLKKVYNRLLLAEPSIKETPEARVINDYILKNNL